MSEDMLKKQLLGLQNPKSLGEMINRLSIIVKAAAPILKKEGYEVKVIKTMLNNKVWDSILIRKI